MSKYIDAEKCEEYFYKHMDDKAMEIALLVIDEMPAADVQEVKHGRWEVLSEVVCRSRRYYIGCSICKHEMKEKTPFCGECGAEMDEVE